MPRQKNKKKTDKQQRFYLSDKIGPPGIAKYAQNVADRTMDYPRIQRWTGLATANELSRDVLNTAGAAGRALWEGAEYLSQTGQEQQDPDGQGQSTRGYLRAIPPPIRRIGTSQTEKEEQGGKNFTDVNEFYQQLQRLGIGTPKQTATKQPQQRGQQGTQPDQEKQAKDRLRLVIREDKPNLITNRPPGEEGGLYPGRTRLTDKSQQQPSSQGGQRPGVLGQAIETINQAMEQTQTQLNNLPEIDPNTAPEKRSNVIRQRKQLQDRLTQLYGEMGRLGQTALSGQYGLQREQIGGRYGLAGTQMGGEYGLKEEQMRGQRERDLARQAMLVDIARDVLGIGPEEIQNRGGLEPKDMVSAWQDFSKRYDQQHMETLQQTSGEADRQAYEQLKYVDFMDTMNRLGVLPSSTKQSGDNQEVDTDFLAGLAEQGGEQKQSNPRQQFRRKLFNSLNEILSTR